MSEKEQTPVSLENLGGGAAKELFQVELQKVLNNILDQNTKATHTRSVTLKVKVKPTEDRDYSDVEITCVSQLAPVASFGTHFFIGRQRGRGVALEHNPKQARLFDDPGLTVAKAEGE